MNKRNFNVKPLKSAFKILIAKCADLDKGVRVIRISIPAALEKKIQTCHINIVKKVFRLPGKQNYLSDPPPPFLFSFLISLWAVATKIHTYHFQIPE